MQEIKSYAQAKDDIKIWPALCDTPAGYFVDVGAHDGRTLSETWAYEEIGWSGVCVEPHPRYTEGLRELRTHSKVYAVCCGPQNVDAVTFSCTENGYLSTCNAGDIEHLDALYGYKKGRLEIHVPMWTLDRILHDAGAPRPIDLLSIDTEGYEIEVLKGFTLNYWKPRIMLIEGFDQAHQDAVKAWMQPTGYFYAMLTGVNLCYCRYPEDVLKVSGVVDGPK